MDNILRIESISMLHEVLNEPPPKHPLLSLLNLSKLNGTSGLGKFDGQKAAASFYAITLKHLKAGRLQYGRSHIDFQGGSLFCTSPEQVGTIENLTFDEVNYSWGLFFHADLIYGTPLSSKIKEYTFFNYSTDEALHLSEDEKATLAELIESIKKELNRPIDKHTKNVLTSGVELLLNHCLRFYDRQFITRERQNKSVAESITNYLHDYFHSDQIHNGLPTVLQCAEQVNLSPNYLSDLLRKETGKTTQEHIHYHLLEAAKNLLLGTNQSVKEIAHSLGFEYPHYLSNLFKKKTGLSPTEYRKQN